MDTLWARHQVAQRGETPAPMAQKTSVLFFLRRNQAPVAVMIPGTALLPRSVKNAGCSLFRGVQTIIWQISKLLQAWSSSAEIVELRHFASLNAHSSGKCGSWITAVGVGLLGEDIVDAIARNGCLVYSGRDESRQYKWAITWL
jgi:hypothetical protein